MRFIFKPVVLTINDTEIQFVNEEVANQFLKMFEDSINSQTEDLAEYTLSEGVDYEIEEIDVYYDPVDAFCEV